MPDVPLDKKLVFSGRRKHLGIWTYDLTVPCYEEIRDFLFFTSILAIVIRQKSDVRSSVSTNVPTQSLLEEERKCCDDSWCAGCC